MMSEVQDSDWEQPDIPLPRPDPIRPAPRAIPAGGGEKVNLRDYIEMRLANLDAQSVLRIESLGKELAIAISASEKSVEKAERSVDHRLEQMNEFRSQLTSQAATFATIELLHSTRIQLEQSQQNLRDTIVSEIRHVESAQAAKLDAMWKVVFSLAGALAAIQATVAWLT